MYLAIEDDHILIIPAVTSNDVSVPCGVVLFCNSIIARCRYVRSVWLSVEYETIHGVGEVKDAEAAVHCRRDR